MPVYALYTGLWDNWTSLQRVFVIYQIKIPDSTYLIEMTKWNDWEMLNKLLS